MKKLILFFFFPLFVMAQNDEDFVDRLVMQKTAELEIQGNRHFFTRKEYCVGHIEMFTMPDGSLCTSKSTYYAVYVFWKEGDDGLRIQKFDNCGAYIPVAVPYIRKLSRITQNKEALAKEEIKAYESEEKDQDPYGNMEVESCQKEYFFSLNGSVFEKRFHNYDITEDSRFKNKNASHNRSLQLIHLEKELAATIKNLETKGRFYREN